MPLHVTEFAAGADPQDVFAVATQKLEEKGLRIDEPSSSVLAGFFCQSGDLRVMVGICPEDPHVNETRPKPVTWT